MRPLATQLRATPPARQRSLRPVTFRGVPGHAQHDLLGHGLDGGGQVHLALGHLGLGLAGRAAEELVDLLAGHGQARRSSRSTP